MSRMCTPCPKIVRDQKTCCMEKGRVSPIIWHILSQSAQSSKQTLLAWFLSVSLGVCVSVCLSVSLCLFPLSNFSDLLCFIYSCSGPNRGHYITIVKSHGLWLLFDDDIVEVSVLVVLKYL